MFFLLRLLDILFMVKPYFLIYNKITTAVILKMPVFMYSVDDNSSFKLSFSLVYVFVSFFLFGFYSPSRLFRSF